jgi:general stress protein YciG
MAEHRGGSGNFAEDRKRASEAGRKGGKASGGNFKNDPQRASQAGSLTTSDPDFVTRPAPPILSLT